MLRYILMLISVSFIGDLGMNSFSFAWPLRGRRTRISAWPKTGCSLPYISSLCFAPHSLHLQSTLAFAFFSSFKRCRISLFQRRRQTQASHARAPGYPAYLAPGFPRSLCARNSSAALKALGPRACHWLFLVDYGARPVAIVRL